MSPKIFAVAALNGYPVPRHRGWRLGAPMRYTGGRIAVVRLRLLSDGQRVLAEVWDQAPGFPAPRRAGRGDENGRGLQLVDALTRGHGGWQPARQPAQDHIRWLRTATGWRSSS